MGVGTMSMGRCSAMRLEMSAPRQSGRGPAAARGAGGLWGAWALPGSTLATTLFPWQQRMGTAIKRVMERERGPQKPPGRGPGLARPPPRCLLPAPRHCCPTPHGGGWGGEPSRGDGGGCAPRFGGEQGWQGAGVGPQRSPSPRVGLWGTSSPHDGDGAGWVQTCSGRAGLGLVRCPTASAPLHQSYSMAPLHLPLSQSHRTGPTGTLEPDAALGQVPARRHRRFCQCWIQPQVGQSTKPHQNPEPGDGSGTTRGRGGGKQGAKPPPTRALPGQGRRRLPSQRKHGCN